MTVLRRGDHGADVAKLQHDLAELGYDVGKIDGDFGARTEAAVLAFQLDYTDVDDDGIPGPQTLARIEQARADHTPANLGRVTVSPTGVLCNQETWSAFERLVEVLTKTPVRYGPGRGLFVDGKFVVTHGPGSLGLKSWKNVLGPTKPSFHCSSFTNFFLGWLLRRNEEYTHAGNIPSLFDLVAKDRSLHQNPGAGPWRGYGEACVPIAPNGSGVARTKFAGTVDARELLVRVDSLPTFMVFGQSTRQRDGSWRKWHHTGLWISRGGRLYRIAADGWRSQTSGYSMTPMKYVEVNAANVSSYDGCAYRVFGVTTTDGRYGDVSRPIAELVVEP